MPPPICRISIAGYHLPPSISSPIASTTSNPSSDPLVRAKNQFHLGYRVIDVSGLSCGIIQHSDPY
jgi:hypothetical protein